MLPEISPLRLIWITPKFPLGMPDGARHATCVLIRHLVQRGVKVELICVLPYDEPTVPMKAEKDLGVASCAFIRRGKASKIHALNPRIPYTLQTFTKPDVQQALQKELQHLLAADHRRQTYVVFDGLHPFAALTAEDLRTLPRKCQGAIYRAHNYETALWDQCAAKARTPWFRWLYRHQASLIKDFERRMSLNSTWVFPVSTDDAAKFKNLAPGVRVAAIPIGMDFPAENDVPLVALQAASFEILFVGRLDWIPNKQGLIWFLENVWPELTARRPDARLTIAGVGDSQWLEDFHYLPGLRILGRVETLEPLYQSCVVTIAPLFQGSGTRVKILESARYARPVVSTSLGAEGSGLEPGVSYFQAESAEDWLAVLSSLTPDACQAAGRKAFQEARERFDGKLLATRFIQTLGALPSQPDYAHPGPLPKEVVC